MTAKAIISSRALYKEISSLMLDDMDKESCLTVGIEKGFLRIGKIKSHCETKDELEIQADVYQLIMLRKVLFHISDQPITILLSDGSRWIGINGIVI